MAKYKHGQSNTKAYKTWVMMRASASKNNLRVYEEWDDFSAFLSDMGEPKENQCLLRLNKQKGYYPKNCEWSERANLAKYMSSKNHRKLEFKGKTQTIQEWAKEVDIKPDTLRHRLNQLNWTVEEALTTKLRTKCK